MKFIISQKNILYHSSMIILKNKTIKSIYKKARFFTPNCSWTYAYTVEKSTKSFLSSIHIYSKSFGRFWYKILLKDSKLTRANGLQYQINNTMYHTKKLYFNRIAQNRIEWEGTEKKHFCKPAESRICKVQANIFA